MQHTIAGGNQWWKLGVTTRLSTVLIWRLRLGSNYYIYCHWWGISLCCLAATTPVGSCVCDTSGGALDQSWREVISNRVLPTGPWRCVGCGDRRGWQTELILNCPSVTTLSVPLLNYSLWVFCPPSATYYCVNSAWPLAIPGAFIHEMHYLY